MTLGSLFDGIGAWQLAAVRAGIKPLWSAEIVPFCRQVTARHFPETIQLGDINNLEWQPSYVDIITASSPCQDLSVAGKRSGINGERSGLFFRAVELVRRINPQFFVWENVPGAFSSNRGLDFKTVLEEICQESVPLPRHGWSRAGLVDGRHCQIAWRLLDAQFWGIPQRRKRIFLVADFTGRRAAKILFEPTGLCRDSPPRSKSQRQTPARPRTNADCSIGFDTGSTFPWAHPELIPSQKTTTKPGVAVYDITHADEVIRSVHGDIANCLNSRMGTGGNQIQIVAYGLGRDAYNQGQNAKFAPTVNREIQPTLTNRGAGAVAAHGVRKLTPTECELLMGLPPGWTAGGSDTQRYRAIGNGVAQPCADFILRQIARFDKKK